MLKSFSKVFEKFADEFAQIDINVKNGLGDVFAKIQQLNEETRKQIEAALQEVINEGPDLAMVNSERGITNLHVPSDVIIDASMPAMDTYFSAKCGMQTGLQEMQKL